ncbi:class I SAM-dependent methyltransferase [Pedobacter cryoconitis]|uniref:Ubiquinone/menaquinone biosynthesis C-methylase UbiE n=1 Tax=Pedobacter cryoconitis TaxID=188932 RepID=A0A7X0J5T1_9SPHI|nr:class I SAM-dependent methyltransferase [Pedobacter cryoconitis]MBB6501636.1 ubiquinone/menaquinone biosynthesis C-methylase UbiE [Pedobacter cryoconitis]
MKNNYDNIAGYYDVLSRLVFFRTQVNAQLDQLKAIPSGSTVLIVGGGTGWILEEIAKIHPSGLTITYVEISVKMIELSKQRNTADNILEYVHTSMEDFKSPVSYDVVITAFFFDNFSAETIGRVFNQLHVLLKSGGKWLFVDFYYTKESGKKWQWLLLKIMYLFFDKVSAVEAKSLINTEHYFRERLYLPVKTAFYYGGFIKSVIYLKSE